jgi:hypothetical protein
MRKTKSLVVAATSLVIAWVLILALPVVAPAQNRASTPSGSGEGISQAVVAYGFLRWDYLEFDRLLATTSGLGLAADLASLDKSLDSLHCDVPKRMAGPHKVLILPPLPNTQWFGFERPGGRNSPERGWLFVTQPFGASPQRVLVVLTSASPEQTSVFWLEHGNEGYTANLLFDSFAKGQISNDTTVVGAATFISFEGENTILLKDWGEPGIGPPEARRRGRIFRLDLKSGAVTLVSPGILPSK